MTSSALIFTLCIFTIFNLDGIDAGEIEDTLLNGHNELRQKHQVGEVKISSELNAKAMKCADHYINKDTIDHSCPFKKTDTNVFGEVGENLYMSWDDDKSSDIEVAKKGLNGWHIEENNYDYGKGAATKDGAVVRHFTQLVWKGANLVGVALKRSSGASVVVTLYDPPGNVKGTYQKNVFPEKGGSGGGGDSGSGGGASSSGGGAGSSGGEGGGGSGSGSGASSNKSEEEEDDDEGFGEGGHAGKGRTRKGRRRGASTRISSALVLPIVMISFLAVKVIN